MKDEFTLVEQREMLLSVLTSINQDGYLELDSSEDPNTASFLTSILEDYADKNKIDITL